MPQKWQVLNRLFSILQFINAASVGGIRAGRATHRNGLASICAVLAGIPEPRLTFSSNNSKALLHRLFWLCAISPTTLKGLNTPQMVREIATQMLKISITI